MKIEKMQLEAETKVTVKILSIDERQKELARMILGISITEASLKAVKELLHL